MYDAISMDLISFESNSMDTSRQSAPQLAQALHQSSSSICGSDDDDAAQLSVNVDMDVDNDSNIISGSESDCSSVISDDRSTVTCVNDMISFYSKATDMLHTLLPDLPHDATTSGDLVSLVTAMQQLQNEFEDVQYRLYLTGDSSYSSSDVCSALCGCVKVSAIHVQLSLHYS
jgi:hypothetical protein